MLIELFICIFVLCTLFIPTLNRPWLLYDENVLFGGKYFPIPISFGEMIEIIQTFGLNFNVVSSNMMYSSNHVTRTAPLGQIFGMTISSIFKKDPFCFHLFNFSLHLINTCLVFFILKTFIKSNSFCQILLTLIWAIHPVMIEPILLSTNCGATYSYMFFFAFLLDFLVNRSKNTNIKRLVIIPILFLIPMLTNEYIISTSLVLFSISFFYNYLEDLTKVEKKSVPELALTSGNSKRGAFSEKSYLIKVLNRSLKETLPYFIGLVIYIIYFFSVNFKSDHPNAGNELIILIERVLWLSPQIFFHLLSLVFYPKILSIDQTIFVKLGESLFSPYSIFCIVFLLAWLLIPLYLFIFKKKGKVLFFISWGYFLAILPFLHILMPSYTLAAERYLYMPLSILVFGVGYYLNDISERTKLNLIPVYTAIILIALSLYTRAFYRTLDWKDNYSFINSTYKSSKDPFLKAIKLGMLGKVTAVFEPNETKKIKSYFVQTLSLLNEAKKEVSEKKEIYSDKTPLVVKSYGLDYDSLLTKIAFLETASKCIELKESHKIGLEILKPYTKNIDKLNPSVSEMYSYLLALDGKEKEAKEVLLRAYETYPNDQLVLNKLIELSISYDKDLNVAEDYLNKELKYYPYDPDILLKAISFYALKEDALKVGKYSYLYGLRTQNFNSYIQSLIFYLKSPDGLNEAIRVKNKLLKINPTNPDLQYLIKKYNLQ